MGIHLQPAPVHFMDCEVWVQEEDDLPQLLSKISFLERSGIIQNHASISNSYRQILFAGPQVFAPLFPYWGTGKAVPYSVLDKIQKEKGWGFWKAEFALYGSKAMCEAAWQEVQNEFQRVPGAQCKAAPQSSPDANKPLVPSEMTKVLVPHAGFPSIEPMEMMNIRGKGGAHTCFSPLFPPNGQQLQKWYHRSKKMVEEAGIDYFSDFHVYGRYIIAIIVLIYGPGGGARIDRLFKELVDDAAKESVSEYRTHIDYMDEIASHYDWNNGAQRKFLQKIKDITDPAGILAQGKSGLWNAGRKKTTA